MARIEAPIAPPDRRVHADAAWIFDVAQHPELRFVGKRVQPGSGTEIDVVGDLTIRGITREVVLRVEQHGQAKDPWGNVRAAFTAKTSIDRKDFGLTWNQVLETGGVRDFRGGLPPCISFSTSYPELGGTRNRTSLPFPLGYLA